MIRYKTAVELVVDMETLRQIDEQLEKIQQGERRMEVAAIIEKLRSV